MNLDQIPDRYPEAFDLLLALADEFSVEVSAIGARPHLFGAGVAVVEQALLDVYAAPVGAT